jgi:hypothetical protein
MSHPLVLALFTDRALATGAAVAVRALGIERESLSIVARSHQEEGELADELGGSPGADIEDSRPAARLGELGAHVLAAIAVVLPGIGPIVSAGPLAAGLGEAAGHVAGGVASMLSRAGLDESTASVWQAQVQAGAILLGVHVSGEERAEAVRAALEESGADQVEVAAWS